MKTLMRILGALTILLMAVAAYVYFSFYPSLTILTGYSAKNMASSVFLGGRSPEFTDAHDNNFSPVNLANDQVNIPEGSVTARVFGMKPRTAIHRPGLGCLLVDEEFDIEGEYLRPRRDTSPKARAYPWGNLPQPDTTFPEIDYAALDSALEWAFSNPEQHKTRSVLVLYKDHIVAEHYAEGYGPDSRLLGWSMTKSVLATLYGILEYRRQIDLHRPAPVPGWEDDNRSSITLHHLLQMNSGLAWEEDYTGLTDVTRMLYQSRDMTEIQADKALLYKPGTHWNYSSGTSNLLSGILRRELGNQQAYLDFPYQALIDRIGMHSMVLEADMSGHYVGSSYAWATTRDWAKFGLLYLHEGVWQGDTLFSSEWVDYVRQPAPASGGQYGAHFWLNSGGKMPDVPQEVYSANGFQGQRVSIVPAHDLVVVRFGLAEPPEFSFNTFLSMVIGAIDGQAINLQ